MAADAKLFEYLYEIEKLTKKNVINYKTESINIWNNVLCSENKKLNELWNETEVEIHHPGKFHKKIKEIKSEKISIVKNDFLYEKNKITDSNCSDLDENIINLYKLHINNLEASEYNKKMDDKFKELLKIINTLKDSTEMKLIYSKYEVSIPSKRVFVPLFETSISVNYDYEKEILILDHDELNFKPNLDFLMQLEFRDIESLNNLLNDFDGDEIDGEEFVQKLLNILKLQYSDIEIINAEKIHYCKQNDAFLLKDLEKISKYLSDGNELPLKFIDGDYKVDSIEDGEGGTEFYTPLPYNESQLRILNSLKSSKGVAVQGPPGTGKSHTIANVIAHYVATGKSVLITSEKQDALTSLKDKVPTDMQSLIVPLLGNDSDAKKLTESSLSEFQTKITTTSTKEEKEKYERLRLERQDVLSKINEMEELILQDRQSENTKFMFEGEEVSFTFLAEELSKYEQKIFFTNPIEKDLFNESYRNQIGKIFISYPYEPNDIYQKYKTVQFVDLVEFKELATITEKNNVTELEMQLINSIGSEFPDLKDINLFVFTNWKENSQFAEMDLSTIDEIINADLESNLIRKKLLLYNLNEDVLNTFKEEILKVLDKNKISLLDKLVNRKFINEKIIDDKTLKNIIDEANTSILIDYYKMHDLLNVNSVNYKSFIDYNLDDFEYSNVKKQFVATKLYLDFVVKNQNVLEKMNLDVNEPEEVIKRLELLQKVRVYYALTDELERITDKKLTVESYEKIRVDIENARIENENYEIQKNLNNKFGDTFIAEYISNYNFFEEQDTLDYCLKYSKIKNILTESDKKFDHVELQKLKNRESKLLVEYITHKTWYEQLQKLNSKQKEMLAEWSTIMTNMGKGTGKKDKKNIKKARSILKEIQDAIPVWIMPFTKVCETFEFNPDKLFDLIIVDESSQSNLTKLGVLARAKQVLIVGDNKQVSHQTVGTSSELLYSIREKHFSKNESLFIDYEDVSLFDFATTKFNQVMLTEHFRCVEEIINFSNMNFYDNKIVPLRNPMKNERLKSDSIIIRKVDGFDEDHINMLEIEESIKILKEIENNDDYLNKNIGFITLLDNKQAGKFLEQVLNDVDLGQSFVERRKLKVGTPATFQGDERDVIILSQVYSRDRLIPQTKKDILRRYNVAVSRAKDQIFYVTSLNIQDFKNHEDIKYKLYSYFLNYKNANVQYETNKHKFDSIFEEEVFKFLVNKGFDVTPQYKVNNYRIDLVIEGEVSRIALELDGEKFHTIDNLPNDIKRQKTLERVGWKFIRIRGRDYFGNKSETLNQLVANLERNEISPKSLLEV